MVESLLISSTYVSTLAGATRLTNATGFFFERDGKLFLVTSRHVVLDEPTGHRPDQLEIELHTDRENLAAIVRIALPLYKDGQPLWRQGVDSAGPVDIAAIEIERGALRIIVSSRHSRRAIWSRSSIASKSAIRC